MSGLRKPRFARPLMAWPTTAKLVPRRAEEPPLGWLTHPRARKAAETSGAAIRLFPVAQAPRNVTGSIPVVADIASLLGIPVVMMGYGLDSDGLHSPNEHYSIAMFQRGIETAIVYLEELAQL